MPLTTTLPDQLQEQFEQAIRDTIAGIGQVRDEIIHELPAQSWPQDSLDVPSVPELDAITVERAGAEQVLLVSLHLSPDPRASIDTDLDDPAYLSDLGGEYTELSDAITETLIAYCEAPRERPSEVFGSERPDLHVTTGPPEENFVVFGTTIWYPEYIKQIYTEGLAGPANHLRLPY